MLKKYFANSSPFRVAPGWAMISYLFLGLWAVVALFPLYWLFITAFKAPVDVDNGPKFLPYVDFQPTLAAWDYLLNDPSAGNIISHPLINTVAIGTMSAFISLVLGAAAAYALMRFEYQIKVGYIFSAILCVLIFIALTSSGMLWYLALIIVIAIYIVIIQTMGRRFKRSMRNNDISFWLVSQRMLPPIAVIIPIYIMFQQLRMLDNPLTLVICYSAINFPLGVWFMRDYLENIPIELEESAFIDGASRYQVLWHIVLPLAAPALVATFLIILVFAWNEYTLALFLSAGPRSQTMPLLVTAQNATRGPQWWNISVLVVVMIAPLVLAALALERFIAKGLLVGAVKS
ncbi:MAG: carbohydrate ABC transporter permease [Chloroflexota bacterium]